MVAVGGAATEEVPEETEGEPICLTRSEGTAVPGVTAGAPTIL